MMRPKPPRLDDLAQLLEEGRIAQHVADLQQPPVFLRRLHQADVLVQVGRHRFFEQHVITGFERRQRRFGVHPIHRRVDQHVAELARADQVLPAFESIFGGDVVQPGEQGAAVRARFGDGDDLHLLGIAQSERAVGVAASARTEDNNVQGCHYRVAPISTLGKY